MNEEQLNELNEIDSLPIPQLFRYPATYLWNLRQLAIEEECKQAPIENNYFIQNPYNYSNHDNDSNIEITTLNDHQWYENYTNSIFVCDGQNTTNHEFCSCNLCST